ncbi:rhodanese-like domain-containing protein [Sulfitobacter guttiformis]|uniref:Rhodanese-like domain-containing protein n=1 Tax=Sulfitobacter guttiformis TaxID=74349 RepID=A0A420DSW9_9RHOB|nr:rhodanese-like domain-containing protein [Sulfitobacter guttiformis]KIN74770.1 Rhodanese-like protein [Sulfitobacter guttiformis KCTC 32187]RKE97342.1 rhodanese-like domain-containing protein [Sulfitobacter guttiformis]
MAAALMVQGVAGQAQDHAASAQAVFTFAGQSVSISPRAADAAKYAGRFAMLAPSCDPFCIAPSNAADGIETLVEGQVLEFLVTAVAANTGLLVDARMPQGRALGFIPGSVSMPFETLAPENEFRDEILKALGARAFQDVFNFADAQNLVIFDSGPTQNDAGVLIAHLLEAGYPPDKIRYYRGGMQVWSVVGLTVQE